MTTSEKTCNSSADQSAALAAYTEICKSYHAIDEFRMKLLGLLPLASLVGVSRPYVSKIQKEAKRDGLLTTKGKLSPDGFDYVNKD